MEPADVPGLPGEAAELVAAEGVEELYPPQRAAVEAGVTEGESLVAAVPTASGKTLVATMAMLAAVERGGTALYIVPLRALASEKHAEFERFESAGVDVAVTTGNFDSDERWLRDQDVIVATSEKVDSLLRNGADWIDDLSCVVADEVHLIDDADRGPTLEVTLAKLRRRNPGLQTVALSATVANAGAIADWLDAELVASDWRPIDLRTGVHYGSALQFGDEQRPLQVESGESQTGAVVRDTVTEDGSALVFVNSRNNAEAAARRLSQTVEPYLDAEERADLRELAEEIRAVSDTQTSEDLAAAVERGGAFHHAGLCVTGDTQILSPDGTFERIDTLVEEASAPRRAVGMSDLQLDNVDITDTFSMGERPILSVETRTGNVLRLTETHPLPVLGERGVEWKPAGEISVGEFVARPRQLDIGPEQPPSFRELVPDKHRVYKKYDTVKSLSKRVDVCDLPSQFRQQYTRDRNINVGSFRKLCDEANTDATEHFDTAIADGGGKPIDVPKRVNEDVCWLAGVVTGDGYITDYDVTLTGRSDLLGVFDRVIDEQFDRATSRGVSPSGTPYRTLHSKIVADVFSTHLVSCEDDDAQLPQIGLPDEHLGAFLSGLFDADGSVSPRKNENGAPCLEFYSTSRPLVEQLKTSLLRFGIVAHRDTRDTEGRVTEHDGRVIRTHQDVHRLTIYGSRQLRQFESEIGFRHPEKARMLREGVKKNPKTDRGQNDVVPPQIGEYVRRVRQAEGLSMAELEPAVPKATLSRFERGVTPMKRTTFESLAGEFKDEIITQVAQSEVFWDKVEKIKQDGSEPLYDLSTESSNFVANGVIAHNTSDHRSLVEDAFRDRLVKIVAATPTLAAGVNTPSRRVVVRDWRRYDGAAGGMVPLDVLEVHQMFGRAGRPGRDPYGEAVLLANDHGELDELFDRYVDADPEPVRSKLAAEPALRTHVLATVATGFAGSREELLAFLDETLYATQTDDPRRLERVVDDVVEYLRRNDFLDVDDGRLRATDVGHTVSRLYLDPMSAAVVIDGLREVGENLSPLGLYHLVARTPDMYELYLRSGDRETYTELLYEREPEIPGESPSEFEESRFEDWLAALKTAKLLEDWTEEREEDRITERYGVGPGDIRGKVDAAEWLLGAAETLAADLGLDCVPEVRTAQRRVRHGVSEELLDLVGVREVGRKRARALYDAGIRTRADLREAEKGVVLWALDERRRTTETVLENAGRRDPDVPADLRPVKPSLDGDGEPTPVATTGDGDGDSDRDRDRGESGGRDRERDDRDQTSLGDF